MIDESWPTRNSSPFLDRAGIATLDGPLLRIVRAPAIAFVRSASFALAADRFLAGLLDRREIFRVRAANLYGVVDAVAEAMRQDGVPDHSVLALSPGAREVLVGGTPVAIWGDWIEVPRASKLLGAEAFGHLAFELRDVTLFGRLDEDPLHAERPQLGCDGSAALRIQLNLRHIPKLGALSPEHLAEPGPAP